MWKYAAAAQVVAHTRPMLALFFCQEGDHYPLTLTPP